jgi:porin
MYKIKYQLLFTSLTLLGFSSISHATDTPFNFAATYDTSRVSVNNNAQQVSRILATLSYEQSFDLLGGTLTPQLSYSIFRGRNGSDIAQDVLGFSNIDAERFSAWQEVNLNWQNDNTLIRIGQLDANANFASLEHAGQFINASFGLTPTALPLPTYPDMEYGIYAEHQLTKQLGVAVGYYRPDEVDDSEEQQPLWMGAVCWLCSDKLTINFGYWRVKHKHVDSVSGAFTYVEGEITEKLHGFSLVSVNDRPQSEDIKKHFKMGLTYDAPFGGEQQQIGLGYSRVLGIDNETVFEVFYLYPLNSFISLQPDVQWLDNTTNSQLDSMIVTLRINIEW